MAVNMAVNEAAFVTMPLISQDDVVRLRQVVRDIAQAQGLSLVDQTKLVTAASELARNTVVYGGGGHAELVPLREGTRSGVRLTLHDEGPGIPDVELALQDGYSTGNGLGLGLSGARRLSDAFEIDSAPGSGTRVSITKWKR